MSTVRKQDAHRALELLEEYHSQLSKPQDRALRNAIERVIRIFKSRLFQALLDIQEFYEVTLLDESKTLQQKTIETLQVKKELSQALNKRNSCSCHMDRKFYPLPLSCDVVFFLFRSLLNGKGILQLRITSHCCPT